MSADSLVRSASRDVTVGLALTVGPLAASVVLTLLFGLLHLAPLRGEGRSVSP